MGLTRPALLLLLLLALLIAPAAAADMIYWGDSCDSMDGWLFWLSSGGAGWVNQWAVSPDYNYTQEYLDYGSPNGIGHWWTKANVPGLLTKTIYFPGSQANMFEFWFWFDSSVTYGYDHDGNPYPQGGTAYFYLDGVPISDTLTWDPFTHRGQWVHVQYPCAGLSGYKDFEVGLYGYDTHDVFLRFDALRIYADPVVPAFTADVTGGDGPLTVKFTDQTVWREGGIVSRLWDFGDGGTSTERNPSHTYNAYGGGAAYDVTLTVITDWGESRFTTKAAYITVGTVAEGDYIVDFTGTPTQGESPLEVTFNATVSPAETNITTWKWDFGDGVTGFGETTTHIYNTYGGEAKYDVTLIGYAAGTGKVNETTKASYITVNGTTGGGAGATSLSTVKLRLIVMDYVGQRFENVTVTATPLESTGPWAWLEDLLGVPGKVDVQNEVLTGTTGTDGGIVFALVESVKYRIDITDPARGISTSITLYPKEDEVPVYIWPATTPPLSAAVNYALTATPLDDDSTELRLTYGDGLKNTTSVRFYVTTETGELVHSETRSHESNVTLIYAMDNDPGAAYLFGFEARHGTYGIITQDQFIRFTDDRPRVDFADWIPLWVYNWAAIAFIVSIAAIFGFQTLKFGVVIVPIFGLLFTYMGWLDTPVLLTLCAMTLGILLYLRYSEGETGT